MQNTNKKVKDYLSLIEHLDGLCSGKIKPRDPFQGLCNELVNFIGYSGVVVRCFELIKEWPLHSGIDKFPVPLDNEDPREVFLSAKIKLWTGRYGENRKNLCKFISNKLKGEVSKL